MIATSGFLTALECTEFVFGRGSAPGPAGGACISGGVLTPKHRLVTALRHSWLEGFRTA